MLAPLRGTTFIKLILSPPWPRHDSSALPYFRTCALPPLRTSQLELSIPQPPWPNGRACKPGLPSAWLARPPAWSTRPPASSTASANDRLTGWQARPDGASDGANDGADRSIGRFPLGAVERLPGFISSFSSNFSLRELAKSLLGLMLRLERMMVFGLLGLALGLERALFTD